MKAREKLFSHLKTRLADLEKEKAMGRKIVGYTPGGYLPEELVLACEAIPIGLIRGGDHSAVDFSLAYICRWVDPFCRAQIAYGISGEDPYYNILDLLAIPITDNHIRAISDVLDYNTGIHIFPFGVPHTKEDSSFRYYLHGIMRLKTKLEELTGRQITKSKLRAAIEICNMDRELLRKISLMRKSKQIPISSRDFVALNHGSFVSDKTVMLGVLESVYEELKEQGTPAHGGLRILLTGSTLAMGDSKIFDLIEKAGGAIVVEEFAEGIKPYWESVQTDGDLMRNLAECYFWRRVPPAWFRPGKERLDFLVQLAKDFNVAGVIWYHLMYRESYKTESHYFPGLLKKETGLPMLTLESDYDAAEVGQMRTRIETFFEILGRSRDG
ncbi:MAG: 2-hydroxyacyl-CoA dehydratase [Desulfobacteraceae bacterium]|nr:2-hydroxyacyl-CoA dehydratase [Desulfobacteraceae bacterium]